MLLLFASLPMPIFATLACSDAFSQFDDRHLHRLTTQLIRRGTASARDLTVLIGLFVWLALAR